jgi:hypothetical protein
MATNSENTPARRIDDNLPAKPLDWEDQPRADVDEPLGEPLQTIADLFTVEANADAELKNGGMPRMLAFDYFKRGYLAGMSSNAGAARQGGITSFEGLTRYMFTFEGMEVDNAFGRYYSVDDVDALVERLASPIPLLTAPAPLTDELPSIDTPDFRALMIDYRDAMGSRRASNIRASIVALVDSKLRSMAQSKPMANGAPRVDALMAKWDDDGATRGSAFIELRDLARELEREAAPAPQQSEGLSDPILSTWPERIYLQWNPDERETYPGISEDLTWCADNIHASDVEYVRADLAKAAPAAPVQTSTLSGALNHARDALRFYANQGHFHMHQPDEWDTVSGEPQNFYEDNSQTATVEDGWVAKQALEDIAGVERYASVAAPVQAEQAQAETVDIAALKKERDRFERMFNAACVDLGLVNEALDLDPDDGGAEPILEAIAELKSKIPAQAEQVEAVRAAYEQAADLCVALVEKHGLHSNFICANAIRALAAPSTTPSNDTSALGDTGGDHG